ncbi:helix-turn-helix domain-containing protein [Streptomyces sp. NPDC004232]|uniref:helix-turn-helix domain-containing protein n=1 Tax=Streptomyces sp. NPDC004232 TaxID=3154454 RepID=UPI0033B191C6
MGRRENSIAPCDQELEKLVRWLREQRARSGLSYAQLAARLALLEPKFRCSASTLIRAASGIQMPKLRAVQAYALACLADVDEAERLWKRARYRAAPTGDCPAPHPRYVRSFAELHVALVDLYRKDGSRPYRQLEMASNNMLARATVGRFLNKSGGRPTRQFVLAFAQACGAKGNSLEEWRQAWDRAEEQRLGGAKKAQARSGLLFAFITPYGRPVFVRSDPQRTLDGREDRRITLAAPSEVPNYQAHVRTLTDLFNFTPLGLPANGPSPVMISLQRGGRLNRAETGPTPGPLPVKGRKRSRYRAKDRKASIRLTSEEFVRWSLNLK